MKERRQWSGDLEELWYMANRRLRTWEWAAKLGIIPRDKNYRDFKEKLTKVRQNLDNDAAKEMLKEFLNDVDLHLKGHLTNYLGKVEKVNKGIVSGAVKELLEDNKKKEHDPIILLYLADYFHKLALSEKKDVQAVENLNKIKADVEVMLYKYNDKNYGGALADLRTIIAQSEMSGFSMHDSAVTLAAVMHDQEVPPEMFDTLLAKAHPIGLIGRDDPIFLYLLDLREGMKYASIVKKYFNKDILDKGIILEDGGVIHEGDEIELKLMGKDSSGKVLRDFTADLLISEILPELESPLDKLKFIKDELEINFESLSKNPKDVTLLQNEMLKIIGENSKDEDVKKWILESPKETNSIMDWRPPRFSLDPLSKVQRELRKLYSDDNQMLLGLTFREAGGDDPFKVKGTLDALQKMLFGTNTKIDKMPIEDVITYMITHPEHAECFLIKRSGVLRGRDFRKEFLADSKSIDRMIREGSDRLHDELVESEIATKEQIQKVKESQGNKHAGNEMPVQDLRGKLPEPSIPEVVPKENKESRVAQAEESASDKASKIIKDIEDVLEKNSNIDSGRRREVAVQIGFFKNLIKNPGQAEKILSALEGIKKMLIDESANKTEQVGWFLSKYRNNKPQMDVKDIAGATAALDAMEGIKETLDHGTNLHVDRIKEIKIQIDFLSNVIKNRQWHEDDHAPLLKAIEIEVSEAKIPSGGLNK